MLRQASLGKITMNHFLKGWTWVLNRKQEICVKKIIVNITFCPVISDKIYLYLEMTVSYLIPFGS